MRASIRSSLVWTSALFALASLLAFAAWAPPAQSAEIVPALGMTKAVDGDDQAKLSGSLSLRGNLIPLLQAEVGVSYRSEDRFDGQLHLRQWPVTASLYLRPASVIYAGAGVGWYNTTYDYDDALALEDETRQDFGVHVGGGLQIPLAEKVGLDLNGRYVMMQDQDAKLVPEKFDPDFWTTSLGLAIRF